MKYLSLLILFSFSLTAKAELTINGEIQVISGQESKLISEDQNIKLDDYETDYELLMTTNNIYTLVVEPSERSQYYSLKVTKDNKVYFDNTFNSSPNKIEHTIKLADGDGTYEFEYTELDSADASRTITYKKLYTLIAKFFKKQNVNKKVKTSKWVQAKDPKIISLAALITEGMESEFEKVIAIDDWITKNIVYNYTSTMMSQKIDALTTLRYKMGICTGYANLFAALARASGLETKVITGKARSGQKKYYHQWNQVKIDSTWYFIDTTWNAGRGRRDYFTKTSHQPSSHYSGKEVNSY